MQLTILLLAGFLLSILSGLFIIPRILVISHKKQLYDLPDARKVHTSPVPRLGGLSFFPAIQMSLFCVIGLALLYYDNSIDFLSINMLHEYLLLFVGITLLYLVGVCDDLVGVGYRYKFLIQIFAALLLVLSGNYFSSLGGFCGIYGISIWVAVPFTILLVVYVTNAINLIDGIDGLASGLCCIALTVLSIIFFIQHDFLYTLMSLCSLGILIPFWFYNVFGNANKGHKLFMGDAGSLTLGYVISFLIIHLCINNQASIESENPYLMVGFSTVLVPLFDVLRVVVHRIRIGRNPFLPDKSHFHHKLLRTGMKVRMVMVTIIAISVFFIMLNMFLAFRLNVTYVFFIDLILWTLMHMYINTKLLEV